VYTMSKQYRRLKTPPQSPTSQLYPPSDTSSNNSRKGDLQIPMSPQQFVTSPANIPERGFEDRKIVVDFRTTLTSHSPAGLQRDEDYDMDDESSEHSIPASIEYHGDVDYAPKGHRAFYLSHYQHDETKSDSWNTGRENGHR
jgi:hypothetical protein